VGEFDTARKTAGNAFSERRLAALRSSYAPRSLARCDLLNDDYLLARDGPIRIYYGPIDAWPLSDVRIIFVGLTPGFAQLAAAAAIYLESPESIRSNEIAYSDCLRAHVAFAGTMKKNLCRMLDEIGVPEWFEIEHSEQLFSEQRPDAAATSALVFPVFKVKRANLDNFSGSQDLGKKPLFQEMLTALLLPRLLRAQRALIVPLGVSANTGLTYLVRQGHVDEARILRNFPHPSGGNGHRMDFFKRDRDLLTAAIGTWRAKIR
jgi:hypothetical protein